jgi:serine/threonine protein kinase
MGKVQFSAHFDPLAKDLLKRLLVSDRTKRLGNLKGGSEDVKRHKWFRGVDWVGLLEKNVRVSLSTIIIITFLFIVYFTGSNHPTLLSSW